jgi:O-methyltransferase
MLKLIKFTKDFLLFVPLTFLFRPFTKFFLFISYYNKLIAWIGSNKKGLLYNDFYSPLRNYEKRYLLYKTVADHFQLQTKEVIYLEFGVAAGASFKWWLQENKNSNSIFRGFDTFEGLPESWGSFYAKGSMYANLPEISDTRAGFLKGLFQDTLPAFLNKEQEILRRNESVRVIHMDADLYSSTIFSLSQLYPFLKKGDVIFFDEFTVAMHEFKAFYEFTKSFYVQLKPIAAVNNFYQVAFEVA